MKLLIVSQYFWPENFRVNDLATELRNRGHEITVLTGWPNYPAGKIYDGFSKYPKEYSSLNGVNILRVPLASRGQGALRLVINYFSFVISASLFGPLKLFRKKYDVIFVYEPSPITVGIPAILFKFIKKTPIVFWVLDLWPESLSAVGAVKSKTILGAIGLIVKFIYKNCDLILAQSKSFISGIEKYCDKNKIIEYFPSWSEELFHNELILPAPEIDKNENLFNILFAGNIGDAQDFPTILEAAEYLRDRRDIRWIIVGDGRMAGWLKAQVEERDLQSNIVITGRFPLERMPSFFVHADALLVTLKANDVFAMTIPGKVQTYLSSGLPIIGALDGEGAKVIHDAGAGYTCNAGDSKALSIVVEKMAALSNIERKAIGTAGRSYYAEHFEKKLLIDKLEHHFNNMVLSRGTTS